MNDSVIRVGEQILEPSNHADLVSLAYFHVYVVQIDYGRDDVDAGLFVADVLIVFVGQLAYSRYEVVHKAGVFIFFYLLEFVEQKGVEVFGRLELYAMVFGLEQTEELSVAVQVVRAMFALFAKSFFFFERKNNL